MRILKIKENNSKNITIKNVRGQNGYHILKLPIKKVKNVKKIFIIGEIRCVNPA